MKLLSIILICSLSLNLFAQQKDKGYFQEYAPGYYQNFILKDVRDVKEKKTEIKSDKYFQMNHKGLDLPNKLTYYKENTVWHQNPISQGNAGTCWAYSTISFYESEVYRIIKKEVDISEAYIVYWEYVEKARRFVRERGNSSFSQGSESNAVARMFSLYGAVPYSEYTGLKDGRKYHSHADMYNEMNAYLKSIKEQNAWNEDEVLATIKAIMNHYIGVPPSEFQIDGEAYTPKTYLNEYLKINPNDYVEILSYMQEPYWEKVEYHVVDNWWHSKEYYNVPLDIFMDIVKKAIREGYTMSIGGDVSEAGFSRETNVALVPDFDIPSDYINENSRQFRFSNKTTTDDHGMHLVGYYTDENGTDWYLIKDSSSGSRNNDINAAEFGYYFFHEDYVKLKMMDFTIHKDAVLDIIQKFK